MPSTLRGNPATLRELLAGIIDYAGLFPPAQLGMTEAVTRYAEYREGPHSWMLGRFVVPAVRLDEFEREATSLLPRGQDSLPWHLSALFGANLKTELERALDFNRAHGNSAGSGNAVVDVAELKVSKPDEIAALARQLKGLFQPYFEFPLSNAPEPFVQVLAKAGVGAKARTGGVRLDSFPSAEQLSRFLEACVTARVPFKVTAGLHHVLRGKYRLTYEAASACATMFGYLNVFLAAATLVAGGSSDEATHVLSLDSPHAVVFEDNHIRVDNGMIALEAVRKTRRLAGGFGSCSFREPVDELVAAGILA